MNRRDLLRGAIAGLLGSAVAVPLLEGAPSFPAHPLHADHWRWWEARRPLMARDTSRGRRWVGLEDEGRFVGLIPAGSVDWDGGWVHIVAPDGSVLRWKLVELVSAQRSWAEVAKEMQSSVMFETELEGGFVLRVGSVSQLADKVTRAIRPAASPHWSRS